MNDQSTVAYQIIIGLLVTFVALAVVFGEEAIPGTPFSNIEVKDEGEKP